MYYIKFILFSQSYFILLIDTFHQRYCVFLQFIEFRHFLLALVVDRSIFVVFQIGIFCNFFLKEKNPH